jgi:hypothetical protein
MARRSLDAYLTPDWATQALLEEFLEIRGDRLLDPCCGDGRMAKALESRFPIVELNDVDRFNRVAQFLYDATQRDLYESHDSDWIVTNPPFTQAGEIAHQCLEHARVGVALLLRCTFGEPCKGRQWLKERPPTALLMLPRISFTGDGATDSAPCWWFVWSRTVRPRIAVRTRESAAGQIFMASVSASSPTNPSQHGRACKRPVTDAAPTLPGLGDF